MYLEYYGLKNNPFALNPDPGVVFMSDSHQEAMATLRYGVIEGKGFLLLTGDVGTGKTTLLHLLIRSLGPKTSYCLISNPSLATDDLYYTLASDFSLPPYTGSKAKFLREFSVMLDGCGQRRERVLLIIDEAHVLPVNLLEEIRLLSNQGVKNSGTLCIFLVGQPELNQHLCNERLLPLRQRIAIRFNLAAFNRDVTASYISFRLQQAGAQRFDFFTGPAIDLIHKVSRGVPRVINILCDQALLSGFAESRPAIDAAMISECVRDLHIPGEADPLPLPQKASRFSGVKRFFAGTRGAILWVSLLLLLLATVAGMFWPTSLLPLQKQ